MRRGARLNRQMVEHWLWWCVVQLALQRTGDPDQAVKAGSKACAWLWED